MGQVKFGALCWNQYTDWPALRDAGELLEWALGNRRKVLVIATAVFFASFFVLPQLSAYFAWKRQLGRRALWLILPFAAAALVARRWRTTSSTCARGGEQHHLGDLSHVVGAASRLAGSSGQRWRPLRRAGSRTMVSN